MKCAYEEKECSSACIHTNTCHVYKLIKGKAPCMGCQGHTSECHVECEKYRIWSEARKEKMEKINKERKKDCESYGRTRDAVRRMQAHRHRRKT